MKSIDQHEIENAIKLRECGKPEEALALLNKLLLDNPENPDLHYQIAWSYDLMGKESEAVNFYEKAISLGLVNDREGAMLGLGSTYRCLGQYEKSLEIFDRATIEFPNNKALRVFQALSFYNVKQFNKSVSELLLLLLDTTNDKEIKSYDRALRFYSDKLDEVWK